VFYKKPAARGGRGTKVKEQFLISFTYGLQLLTVSPASAAQASLPAPPSPVYKTQDTPDTQETCLPAGEVNIANIPTLKLKALFKDIETELKYRQVTDKKKALERMRDIASEYGLTLSEVLDKQTNDRKDRQNTKKPESSPTQKYRNPDNPDQTWSGRGQQPKWVKEALAKGKTLEEFLNQQPETAAKEQEREVFNL
jgi:DNA-binding protein H-NS